MQRGVGKHEDKGGRKMAVAKVIELTAASTTGIEDAVEKGIAKAEETLENVKGVWIQNITCEVEDGKIREWHVNMKLTFVLNG